MRLTLSDNDKQLLAELTKHPGWDVLRRTVQDSAEKRSHGMAKVLLFTQEAVDPLLLAHDRGYWKAMLDLIEKPERAARQTAKEQVIT